MDFGFSEEQEMLRKLARDFLEKECPKTSVREMEESESTFPTELWSKMAELGWMGLVFPEEYGGGGGGFLDLAILVEEMGRALLPCPFVSTVVLCGLPILHFGTQAQRTDFLPRIATGEAFLALALTEPRACYGPEGIAVRAVGDQDRFVIDGTKLFVADAHKADYLLCVTRTGDSERKEDGITLVLVDAKTKGIRYVPLRTIAGDRQYQVVFQDVRVSREAMLGQLNRGWELVEKILEWGAAAECAMMVGGAQMVLDMTGDYAKERVQFGRPIGSFQAVQHMIANMAIDLEGARYVTYQAAWRLGQNLPSTLEVSVAKAWVSEVYKRICAQGHQIHGAIGFTMDCDMQLYFRRAQADAVTFGDTYFHEEVVAQQIGL